MLTPHGMFKGVKNFLETKCKLNKLLIPVYLYSYLGSQLNIQLINGTINTWTFGSG